MERDFTIPQGSYKIGRDIPEGVYLIGILNDHGYIYITSPNGNKEQYYIREHEEKMVHVELKKGDSLEISCKAMMRRITRFVEDDKCNLLEEVATFETDLAARRGKKR